MRILTHNDNAIRMIDTFKRYNTELTEILEDDNCFRNIKGVDGKVFCGTFTAKVFVGVKPIGIYKFDCRHWMNILRLSERELKPKLTQIKEYNKRVV